MQDQCQARSHTHFKHRSENDVKITKQIVPKCVPKSLSCGTSLATSGDFDFEAIWNRFRVHLGGKMKPKSSKNEYKLGYDFSHGSGSLGLRHGCQWGDSPGDDKKQIEGVETIARP